MIFDRLNWETNYVFLLIWYKHEIMETIIFMNVTGTGCFVISVETAARRKAKVIGKPERIMFDCINSR